MKNIVSISHARRDLPKMVRELQKNPEMVYLVQVRGETIAEIRSAKRLVEPGEAARKLIRLRQKVSPLSRGKTEEPISKRVKDYLYGRENK